MKPDSAF